MKYFLMILVFCFSVGTINAFVSSDDTHIEKVEISDYGGESNDFIYLNVTALKVSNDFELFNHTCYNQKTKQLVSNYESKVFRKARDSLSNSQESIL